MHVATFRTGNGTPPLCQLYRFETIYYGRIQYVAGGAIELHLGFALGFCTSYHNQLYLREKVHRQMPRLMLK